MAKKKNGRLIVIAGPSGVGKTTVCRRLLERGYRFSVSATTRAPRGTEQDGIDYFFVSPERFQEMIQKNELFEYAQVFGKNYYGTPVAQVREAVNRGEVLLLDIDVQGATQLRERAAKEKIPARLIFLLPPDFATLEARIRGRATDTPEAIERRLQEAKNELAMSPQFDARIVNNDLEQTIDEVIKNIEREDSTA